MQNTFNRDTERFLSVYAYAMKNKSPAKAGNKAGQLQQVVSAPAPKASAKPACADAAAARRPSMTSKWPGYLRGAVGVANELPQMLLKKLYLSLT